MGRISDNMAGIPERRTLCRGNEVVSEEAVSLLSGGDYGIFRSTFVTCGSCGGCILYAGIFYDPCYCCAHGYLGRPGIGLAIAGMYYLFGQRNPAFLHGDCGAVFI